MTFKLFFNCKISDYYQCAVLFDQSKGISLTVRDQITISVLFCLT